jgi:outer membrane protein OmpA-like peptidoglycan-associated protein
VFFGSTFMEWGSAIMPSIVKILLGALATAVLTWFLYGPMGLGTKCAADAIPSTGTAAAVPAAAPAEAPATAESVASCQANVNTVIASKKINFGSGNAVITEFSMPTVEAVATAVKECAGTQIEVGGHTDQMGDDASNMKLSEDRANAIVAALVERGVPKERLTAKGYGETKLLDTATSRDALAKNRRIEFGVATSAATAPTTPAQ